MIKEGDKVRIIDKSPLACCDGKEGRIRCKHSSGGFVVFTDHLCPELYHPDGKGYPEGRDFCRIELLESEHRTTEKRGELKP